MGVLEHGRSATDPTPLTSPARHARPRAPWAAPCPACDGNVPCQAMDSGIGARIERRHSTPPRVDIHPNKQAATRAGGPVDLLHLKPASPALATHTQHPLPGRQSHLPLEHLNALGHPFDLRCIRGHLQVRQQMRISLQYAEELCSVDRIRREVGRMNRCGCGGRRTLVAGSVRLPCGRGHFGIRHHHPCELVPMRPSQIYALSS